MKESVQQTALTFDTKILLEGISNASDLLQTLRVELDPNNTTFLQETKWDHLTAHYSNLDLKQNIFALGQELTTHDIALYAIHKENGKFYIRLIPQEEMALFEAKSTKDGKTVSLCLQDAKKFGEAAYRLEGIADRLPSKTYYLDSTESHYIDFIGSELFTKSPDIKPGAYSYYHLDLSTWPPQKIIFNKPIINVIHSPIHKLYAALELNAKNHFNISRIRIGHDIDDLCSWDFIDLQEEIGGTHFFRWVELSWVGNDLLLLDENNLWCVKSAAIGGRTIQRISDINTCGCSLNCSPTVIKTNNGGTFIPSNKKLWEWKDGELSNTGITITKLYAKRFSTAKLGKTGFVTTTRKGRIAVHTQTDTGSTRFLDFADATSLNCVKELNEDWIIFFNNEIYADMDNDLAQLWNPKTNSWLRMKFGMLDNSTIHNIMLNENGTAFIADNHGKLYCIEHFIEVLSRVNTKEDRDLLESNKWYDGRGEKQAPPSYLPEKHCQAVQNEKEMTLEERIEMLSKLKITEPKTKDKK